MSIVRLFVGARLLACAASLCSIVVSSVSMVCSPSKSASRSISAHSLVSAYCSISLFFTSFRHMPSLDFSNLALALIFCLSFCNRDRLSHPCLSFSMSSGLGFFFIKNSHFLCCFLHCICYFFSFELDCYRLMGCIFISDLPFLILKPPGSSSLRIFWTRCLSESLSGLTLVFLFLVG